MVGGVDYPPLTTFFSVSLGVTRASDRPVPYGHGLFFRAVLTLSMLVLKEEGWFKVRC